MEVEGDQGMNKHGGKVERSGVEPVDTAKFIRKSLAVEAW